MVGISFWVIHSGEIYGTVGKLLIHLMGLVFIFLCITGLIYFIVPSWMRFKKSRNLPVTRIVKVNRFSLKWHNKLGWILLPLLIITTLTGMFLRPPLLITIFSSTVKKIPYTELDTPNAWFDKLRRVICRESNNRFAFIALDGMYFAYSSLIGEMVPVGNQPPVSVMDVNVFEKTSQCRYGIWLWSFIQPVFLIPVLVVFTS